MRAGHACTGSYNLCIMYTCSESKMNRTCLDRRRLEEAHLIISILDVFSHYSESFPVWSINTNVMKTLDVISPVYYEAFTTRYAGRLLRLNTYFPH